MLLALGLLRQPDARGRSGLAELRAGPAGARQDTRGSRGAWETLRLTEERAVSLDASELGQQLSVGIWGCSAGLRGCSRLALGSQAPAWSWPPLRSWCTSAEIADPRKRRGTWSRLLQAEMISLAAEMSCSRTSR